MNLDDHTLTIRAAPYAFASVADVECECGWKEVEPGFHFRGDPQALVRVLCDKWAQHLRPES